MSNRQKYLLITLGVLTVIVTAGLWLYNTYQFTTINFSDPIKKVVIAKAVSHGGEGGHVTKGGRQVESGKMMILHRGAYVIGIEGDGIQSQELPIDLDAKSVTKTLDYNLTREKLMEILQKESPDINKAVSDKYPTLDSLYTYSRRNLYKKGEWLGAVLTYTGTDKDNRDSLRFIMHKKDGKWEFVAKPEIMISSQKYPEIPKDIISDVDKASYLPGAENSPSINPNDD